MTKSKWAWLGDFSPKTKVTSASWENACHVDEFDEDGDDEENEYAVGGRDAKMALDSPVHQNTSQDEDSEENDDERTGQKQAVSLSNESHKSDVSCTDGKRDAFSSPGAPVKSSLAGHEHSSKSSKSLASSSKAPSASSTNSYVAS